MPTTDGAKILLGITGNIASGKSTVVSMLKERGAQHLDADLVYRDLVRPGMPLLETLVAAFGEGILSASGELDRKALGAIVFSDPAQLARLDHLTHPAIIAETDRRAAEIPSGVVIIDSVKMIETGHADVCDEVWLVTTPEATQVARLMERNGLSENDAWQRVKAQPPLATKLARADVVLDNSGSIDDLRRQVDAAWHTLITNPSPYPKGHPMPTKIQVFSDYVCPYAWTAQRWLYEVKKELGDDLEITWRYFSIEQVNKADDAPNVWEHPNDGSSSTMRAFQGSHAARKQGEEAFLRFHAALFNQRHVNKRNLGTQSILEQTAEQAGLDLERFREDLKSDEVFAIFRDDYTYAHDELGIFGVPTILFENGQSAYLRIKIGEIPSDPVQAWNEFVAIVRDRPDVLEIKRPTPPQG